MPSATCCRQNLGSNGEAGPRIPGWLSSQIRTNDQFRNLDQRFRVLDEFGDYRQIISLSSPTIEEVAGPSEGNIIARIANDEMAAMVDRYPERFPGSLPRCRCTTWRQALQSWIAPYPNFAPAACSFRPRLTDDQ